MQLKSTAALVGLGTVLAFISPQALPQEIVAPLAEPAEIIGLDVIGSTEKWQLNLAGAFHTTSAWKVTVDDNPVDPLGPTAARSTSRICFVGDSRRASSCSYFYDLFRSNREDEHLNRLSIVQLAPGPPAIRGVLPQAASQCSACFVQQTAIWTYDAATRKFRLALAADLGNGSRQRLLTHGPIARPIESELPSIEARLGLSSPGK